MPTATVDVVAAGLTLLVAYSMTTPFSLRGDYRRIHWQINDLSEDDRFE